MRCVYVANGTDAERERTSGNFEEQWTGTQENS